MTNREVLIKSLQDKEADICSDYSACEECKMEWLDKEWED